MNMLKVCFNYFIYNFCIDIIFNKIKANFLTAAITGIPKQGEHLSKVSHKNDDEHYYNCIVKGIERRTSDSGKKYYVVDLTYQYCDGSVFDDDTWLEEQTNAQMETLVKVEEEEVDKYYNDIEDNYGKLLDTEEADAIERRNVLSLKYDLYYFFR